MLKSATSHSDLRGVRGRDRLCDELRDGQRGVHHDGLRDLRPQARVGGRVEAERVESLPERVQQRGPAGRQRLADRPQDDGSEATGREAAAGGYRGAVQRRAARHPPRREDATRVGDAGPKGTVGQLRVCGRGQLFVNGDCIVKRKQLRRIKHKV